MDDDCCHPYDDPPCGGCPCCLEAQRYHSITEYLRWRKMRLIVKFTILEIVSDGKSHDVEGEVYTRYPHANYDYVRVTIRRLVKTGEIELAKSHPYWPEYRMVSQ